MKKLVATIFGLIVTSLFVTTVAAAEYEVKKGDTLWDIANSHNTTVETIMSNNGLKDSLIYPKQVLQINGEKEVEKKSEIKYYTVKKGDTLSDISDKYGADVTVNYLKNVNNLSSDFIYAGEKLIVGGVAPSQTNTVTTTSVQETKANTQPVESSTETKNIQANNNPQPEVNETVEKQEPVEAATAEVASENDSNPSGKTISVEATAYTAYCDGCSGITATGMDLRSNPNAKVIAVDPNVIPLGTEVYVEGYGHAIAGDTGGAIKGNKIDIHVPTKDEAYNWGRKTVNVTIVE